MMNFGRIGYKLTFLLFLIIISTNYSAVVKNINNKQNIKSTKCKSSNCGNRTQSSTTSRKSKGFMKTYKKRKNKYPANKKKVNLSRSQIATQTRPLNYKSNKPRRKKRNIYRTSYDNHKLYQRISTETTEDEENDMSALEEEEDIDDANGMEDDDDESGEEESQEVSSKNSDIAEVSRSSGPEIENTIRTFNGQNVRKVFHGIEKGVVDGVNITHLSYMLYKIVKEYDIHSVIDIPCRNTLNWIPELLPHIDFEVIDFKYYCVDSDEESQTDIQPIFSDAGNPEFLHTTPEKSIDLPQVDLVFSWDGPQQWGIRKTWAFFSGLRQVRPTYILITNTPAVRNPHQDHGEINLRKQPFHFSQPMRVISSVSTDEPKQLLLYETDAIREGF